MQRPHKPDRIFEHEGFSDYTENQLSVLKATFEEELGFYTLSNDDVNGLVKKNNGKNSIIRETKFSRQKIKEKWIVNQELFTKCKLKKKNTIIKPTEKTVEIKKLCQNSENSRGKEILDTERKNETKIDKMENSSKLLSIPQPNNKEFSSKILGRNSNFYLDCQVCLEILEAKNEADLAFRLDHTYPKRSDYFCCRFCGLKCSNFSYMQDHRRNSHSAELRRILRHCFHGQIR